MNLPEARSLAFQLMQRHNLYGWTLKFNGRPYKRSGLCNTRLKIIELSTRFVLVNEEARIRNTILHEIAHALTPKGEPSHGATWQRIAKEIGCTGERCYSEADGLPLVKAEQGYKANCPNCQKEFKRHRNTRRYFACTDCCKAYNNGKFTDRFLLTYQRIGV